MRYLLMGAALALSFCSFEVSAIEKDDILLRSPLPSQASQVPPALRPKPKPVRRRLAKISARKRLDFSKVTL